MSKLFNISDEERERIKFLHETKNLHAVIIEQADMGYDIATIQAELGNVNTDEKKIVDIVKNYKDKASFQNFVNQYKTKTGKDFGTDIRQAIFGGQDRVEIADLSNHLKSLGVTLADAQTGTKARYEFKGLDTPAAKKDTKLVNNRQTNINNIFCSVKNGIIVNPASKFNNITWEKWKATYKPTDAELSVAKSSCSSGKKLRQKSGQSVNTRFADSAKSLGIQNGKMDLQTLQTILKTLEGSTEAPATAATGGAPDIAKLTAALNTLNQG